jgi:hypothetical protein
MLNVAIMNGFLVFRADHKPSSSSRRSKKRYKGVYLDGWKEKQGFLVVPRPAAPSSSYVPSNSTFWSLVDTVSANLVVQFKVSPDEFVVRSHEFLRNFFRYDILNNQA